MNILHANLQCCSTNLRSIIRKMATNPHVSLSPHSCGQFEACPLLLSGAPSFLPNFLTIQPRLIPALPRFLQGVKLNNSGLVLLAANLIHYGIQNIPPATLVLIAGQTAIFLDPGVLPDVTDACISAYLIAYAKDWLRMVLSPFYHGSDMHLYYNMLSLLYKGSWLERKFGTFYYLYLVTVFTALINFMYVGLGLFLTWLFGDDGYVQACAVGFSGVLFGMKVLTSHYSPREDEMFLGFLPVPSKHIYWLELALIQLMVPNASFVGHLSGILIASLYVYGPLRRLMDLFLTPAGSSVDHAPGLTSPRRNSVDDVTGRQPEPEPGRRVREPSLDIVMLGAARQPLRPFYSGIYHRLSQLVW